jgi:hypothetical protein
MFAPFVFSASLYPLGLWTKTEHPTGRLIGTPFDIQVVE